MGQRLSKGAASETDPDVEMGLPRWWVDDEEYRVWVGFAMVEQGRHGVAGCISGGGGLR